MHGKGKHSSASWQIAKRILLSVTAIILVMSVSGCYLFPEEAVVLEPPLRTPPQVTYDYMEVKKTTIENKITGSGTFESVNRQEYFFKLDGKRLKAMYVKAGDDIQAGDLIAELDSDDLLKRIKQKESDIRKAEIAYNQLVTTSRLDIQRAKLELDELRKEYERLKAIPDATPKAQLEEIEKQIRLQEISYQKLLETNSTGENGKLGSQIQLAQISLEEEKAALADLKKELEDYRLYSTITGKVYYADSSLKPGDFIKAYTTIATVHDPTQLRLTYSGDKAFQFRLGSEVTVTVNKKDYKGYVVMTPTSMPEDVNPELKGKVVIDLPEMPSDAKIGTPATITLVMDRRENVIAIPKHLVKSVDGRSIVYVLKDNIRAERVVQLGLTTETQVEIVSGLEEGDLVIVK